MLRLVISRAARHDQLELVEYIEREAGPIVAERFLSAMIKAFEDLAEMPTIGVSRSFGARFKDLRMWPVPKYSRYLIFYRTRKTKIEIVRVLNGMRNLETIFGDP